MGPGTASLRMLGFMQKTLSILAVLHFSLSAGESLQDGAEFDYIVVGGGAAGEIVASRLSENPNIMVALLEAAEEPDLNMEPNNFPKVSQGGDRYGFSTYQDGFSAQYIQDENVRVIAEEFTGGATPWVHMMHLRGHPNDYQGWADAAGDNSWNYENMLRYFIRSEQVKDQRTLDSSVTGYGTEGTLNLTRESSDANSKIIQAFEELGYEYHLHLNATLGITEPFYYMSEGQFQSIYKSYIVPARNRSNLFIYPKTTATLIRFDDDQTATGVQAYNSDDTYVEVRARQEIILAGGVIRTPQLMLLSGIGPAADLDDWSISVVSDLPVGEGMSDRVGAIVAFELKESNDSTRTLKDYMAPTTVAFKALDSLADTPDYQATNHIFPRNSESLPKLCVDSYQYKAEICEKLQEINREHELMFSVVSITRPQSTGFMALNSLDMFDDPFIYMGYFAETADLENLAASLGDFSNIINTENFSGLEAELVDFKLAECGSLEQNSPDYWMCYGQYMSTTTWNVVGTAQMGDVLDSKLNVRGVQKLRVVDSSAIPFAHSGYLLPSIIVMAEKAADLILDNVEISNVVTDVSEENFSASEEGSSVSEDSSLASEENASAQGSNNSDENEDSPQSENEAIPSSESEAVPSSENETSPLPEDEEGALAPAESSSPSDGKTSAQGSNNSNTDSSLKSQEIASPQEANDLDENGDSSRSETQGSPSSENETAPSSEDEQGSSASGENESAQGSNDLYEESLSDSQRNISAQGTNNSNENEASPQSENEAASLFEDEDGASASEKSSSASVENASAQETNDSAEPAREASEAAGIESEGESTSKSENENNLSASEETSKENSSAQRENDSDLETPIELDDASTPATDNEAKPTHKDAALSGSEGDVQSEDDVFVQSSNNSTTEDETTSLPLSANSTLNAHKIRAVAHLLRSMGKSASDELAESFESDEAISVASEIVTNSTIEVDEGTESELLGVLIAHVLRGSDNESENETETVSGQSGSEGEGSGNDVSDQAAENETNITSETQANSILDALEDGAVAWLLGSMGSSGSDKKESILESENKTEAVSGQSGSEGEGSGNDVSDQVAENETNSTSETRANDAVAWLLGMGSAGSDEEPITNLEDNEEAESELSAVLAAHLLRDSESTTEAIRGLFGRSESESEASNGWFESDSEPDEATGLFGSGTANNDDEKEKSNLGRHYLRMRMLTGR